MRAEIHNVGGTSTVVVGMYGNNVAYPMSALVRNVSGPGTVYLGHAGVTASTGLPLASGESLTIDMVNEALYGVATTTTTVNVLRRGDL